MKNNYLTKILALILAFVGFDSVAQYTVSAIPHQVYTAALPISFTMDDTFSAMIPLTFDFTFFGNTYNQMAVSTNGYIEFGGNHLVEGEISPWAFTTTIPDAAFPVKNSFLGCYHDLNNANGEGTITYGVVGSAPFRKFVVIYTNNSHFSNALNKSSFQMVLYETLNILDSQIIQKDITATWNQGSTVIGVINIDGLVAFTPPGRNTGPWGATLEGWRFNPGSALPDAYHFTKCDDDADGFVSFNLQVAQNALWVSNPSGVTFHASEADAIGQQNTLSTNYTNGAANMEVIYANANGQIKPVMLRVVNCQNDFDGDTVSSSDEDTNGDTNLANDDTDNDGVPNFVDNDDDGDLVLTNEEYVFVDRNAQNPNAILDTDNDGIPNYLDNDDDGDNVLTINEDYNGNNNPADDDTNNDGTPDYLQNSVALGVATNQFQKSAIAIYPNPASNVLNIDNRSGMEISAITVYTVNGVLVKQVKQTETLTTIPVADLQSGMYFVKVEAGNQTNNYKFIKK